MAQAKPRRTRSSSPSATASAPAGEAQAPTLVPSRRQYLELKEAHPEAILLYRLGDFYESFDDDAKTVARDARITLTSRNFGRNGRVPMAGIPHHALNHYLGRLLAAGHTIAIAEQVSEPGKGLVEREVTRVLSPGTVADASLLPAGESRYLAALRVESARYGLAWVDVSTGEFAVAQFVGQDAEVQLADTLTRINPAECLIADHVDDEQAESDRPLAIPGHRTRMERWHFEPSRAARGLCLHFGTKSLAPFGCADLPAAVGAAGAILAYLERTNKRLLRLLTGIRTDAADAHVGLDAASRRNLELTRSLKTHGSRGSLLGVLDQTRTAMGARALRRLVTQPLTDRVTLEYRQEIIAALVGRPIDQAALADTLVSIGDLERLVGRVAQGGGAIRDFLDLARALERLPGLRALLRETGAAALVAFADDLNPCADVRDLVESAVGDDIDGIPAIRSGFWPELDAALAGAHETRSWLAGLERSERDRTGIRSLKVGFNKVFGYYIEVTRSNLALVPDDYVRKQTVAGGERFVTVPLKEAEAFVLAADEEIASLERAALAHLTSAITPATGRLALAATRLALLDALRSLAEVADRHAWTRPELIDSAVLEITGGRHPVVEANLAGTAGNDGDAGSVGIAGDAFIPNDCFLGDPGPTVLLVTGPNMGGKSTFLRQTAVIVLLAQIGSFVPALSAKIGMVDRIFTRVGAQDDLAGGASTFMVEMVETATILHQATDRSLLVLDEIGRGTGTADGLAIARAVLEDIHDRLGARTLFATHYLELTGLDRHFPQIANIHASAIEEDGRVIFLYRLRPGPADRAYGVQVARLAGLPPRVAARAETLLASMATNGPSVAPVDDQIGPHPFQPESARPHNLSHDEETRVHGRRVAESPAPTYQLAFDGFPAGSDAIERLARSLRDLDLTNLTPRQALDWLFSEQARLGTS